MGVAAMEQYLSPATLARVNDLPLIAKTVADGFLHGMQNSLLRGTGIEFSQYRAYEPGDSLSRIDWKLFGRSDRYFIRQAEQESETTIWIVLDCSASMDVSEQNSSWSKLEYAKHLAATFGYIAQQQGDNLGFLALSTQGITCLPPGSGIKQWQRMIGELSTLNSGEVFPDSKLFNYYASALQQPNLVFVISDFYQQNQEINDFLKQIHISNNEVVAIQLQTEQELSFDYKGVTRFKDLETGEELLLDAKTAKEQYFDNFIKEQQQLKSDLNTLGVALYSFNINEPMDAILAEYLNARFQILSSSVHKEAVR